MVDIAPGGSGGTIATTPFSSGPRSSPVDSLTMRASNPYTGKDGLPNRVGTRSTPGWADRMGQPDSVCQ
ncbi:hypothetical protein G6F54_014552 [Rhizopus delemar]|nr:hypothetical protein G6F54_014552 [Rhizopus delemar]